MTFIEIFLWYLLLFILILFIIGLLIQYFVPTAMIFFVGAVVLSILFFAILSGLHYLRDGKNILQKILSQE